MAVAGVLLDLLMAVMNSMEVWDGAARSRRLGLQWRDAVTARMRATDRYEPYETLVAEAAAGLALPSDAPARLLAGWGTMEPWPDSSSLGDLALPYGFVTNCSAELATVAAGRSRLDPIFTLSAEEAGWYKPDARAYLEGCRRLGTDPARTAFLAGAPYDAAGARAAGLRAWLIRRRTDQPPPGSSVTVAGSIAEAIAAIGEEPPS